MHSADLGSMLTPRGLTRSHNRSNSNSREPGLADALDWRSGMSREGLAHPHNALMVTTASPRDDIVALRLSEPTYLAPHKVFSKALVQEFMFIMSMSL